MTFMIDLAQRTNYLSVYHEVDECCVKVTVLLVGMLERS